MSGEPRVFLVGAGPGDTGLLTLRAVRCLERADLVVYDQLVSPRTLHFAPQAEKLCVRALAEHHPERVPHIHRTLIEAARKGKLVVRLKGGDPLVFGRGGEEAEALREAGIPFEIVPGVTAALGAAAYAGIPLTHRQHSSAVAFVTGHEDPAKPDSLLDWPALARFPGTLVFYMGLSRLETVTRTLIGNGMAPETLAAVVQWATLPSQRTVEATLGTLAEAVRAAGLTAPALVILGGVVALRSSVAWLEKRPLFGKRVLVTRPAGQDEGMMADLEALGAEVFSQPTVVIGEPDDWRPADEAISRLSEFHWLVFTSVNGVTSFLRRLLRSGRDLRALGRVLLAAIGPATADALRGFHLHANVLPAVFDSENLAAALKPLVADQNVLLARADRGLDVLRERLGNVARVEQVAVYSQKDIPSAEPEVQEMLANGRIDFVTLTSSNIARALRNMLDGAALAALASGRTRIVTISPRTSTAVRELSWPVAAEAAKYTADGVIAALVSLACPS